MRPAGWKLFGHAMFELSQLNVTEVAEFVQRNFQNLFTKGAPPGKQIQKLLGEHRRRLPSSLQESQWVFPSKRTGKPSHPWSAQRRWLLRAGEKVGAGRLGWHAFRHTYSSLLNEHGTDVKVQQELLRHADIRTTMNIYTRAVPERLRTANSK